MALHLPRSGQHITQTKPPSTRRKAPDSNNAITSASTSRDKYIPGENGKVARAKLSKKRKMPPVTKEESVNEVNDQIEADEMEIDSPKTAQSVKRLSTKPKADDAEALAKRGRGPPKKKRKIKHELYEEYVRDVSTSGDLETAEMAIATAVKAVTPLFPNLKKSRLSSTPIPAATQASERVIPDSDEQEPALEASAEPEASSIREVQDSDYSPEAATMALDHSPIPRRSRRSQISSIPRSSTSPPFRPSPIAPVKAPPVSDPSPSRKLTARIRMMSHLTPDHHIHRQRLLESLTLLDQKERRLELVMKGLLPVKVLDEDLGTLKMASLLQSVQAKAIELGMWSASVEQEEMFKDKLDNEITKTRLGERSARQREQERIERNKEEDSQRREAVREAWGIYQITPEERSREEEAEAAEERVRLAEERGRAAAKWKDPKARSKIVVIKGWVEGAEVVKLEKPKVSPGKEKKGRELDVVLIATQTSRSGRIMRTSARKAAATRV